MRNVHVELDVGICSGIIIVQCVRASMMHSFSIFTEKALQATLEVHSNYVISPVFLSCLENLERDVQCLVPGCSHYMSS